MDADGKAKGAVLIFRDITQRRAAEKQIQNLARFPEENPNPVMRVDRKGKVMYANPACRDMGLEPCIKPGLTIPPEWLAMVDKAFAAKGQQAADITVGEKILLLSVAPVADEGYANLYTIDITERRRKESELARLNRTLKAISESNQTMMRARNESDFMEEACRIIVESCGHAMVWIGMAEQDEGKTVRPVAHSGFEDGYLETLHVTWADSELGRGPTGTAIRTGKASQCRNMLTDPAFAPWRAEALNRGYASSIALPLIAEERAFGAVMIYSRESDPFSPDEVSLLEELANDLSYGIQAIRLRAARDTLLVQVEEQRRLARGAGRRARRRLCIALGGGPGLRCRWQSPPGERRLDQTARIRPDSTEHRRNGIPVEHAHSRRPPARSGAVADRPRPGGRAHVGRTLPPHRRRRARNVHPGLGGPA